MTLNSIQGWDYYSGDHCSEERPFIIVVAGSNLFRSGYNCYSPIQYPFLIIAGWYNLFLSGYNC